MRDVIILGGGYAGLGAALRLGARGVNSTILEGAPSIGGLGACTPVGGILLERTYHHIKAEDTHLVDLIEDLGLGDRLRWSDTRMGYYIGGRIYPLSTPLDLIAFKPLPLLDRLRFGRGFLRATRTDGRTLDGMDAEQWVVRTWGRTVYERLMRPLLLNKFGMPPEKVSAAFLHGRIKGLSSSKSKVRGGEKMGYLLGSNQLITDALAAKVGESTEIVTSAPIDRIDLRDDGFEVSTACGTFPARKVINTLPMPVFERIDKNFPFASAIAYQGAINGIFVVEQDLTDYYWINILDDDISFRILVKQSMLFDHAKTIIYCGNYLGECDDLFKKSNDEVADIYMCDLRKMFGPIDVVQRSVFRTSFATPIFDRDFGGKTAGMDRSVPNMVFAGHVKVYPGTRTLSSALRTGYEAADTVASALAGKAAPTPGADDVGATGPGHAPAQRKHASG